MNEKCIKCQEKAYWEVGISIMIHDFYMFECSGNNEFQEFFCDEHFVELEGCGNVVEFRIIGDMKWLDFGDFENYHILNELVRKRKIRAKSRHNNKSLDLYL